MTVSINGVYSPTYKNGVLVKETLSVANDTVNRGYYAATTLSTVDSDLATGNIKSGITVFGKVGSADVHDISDADAAVGDVKDPKTFYAVSGGIKTGTMPTVALAPGSSAYPAGYHAGDGGGLPAIDADLATGNIKNGITIFNVPGHTNVRDSSDADLTAPEAPTGKFFYAGGGARKTGSGTKTLNPANETVNAGYYAATTLSAVDAQLAAANIKSGIVIFGFTGVATVQDIADADAVLGDVKNGKTFYSVTGGRKTGNLATVAITDVNDDYPAGYHAGNVGGLVAIDAQLVTGSIKSGVTIFGVAGAATVQDIADANAGVGDVLDPKTFYSVTGARKTGTMATVALAAGANAYPAGYHVGAANLTAVDGDLVSGNIRSGQTIFGVAGHADVRDVSDANALVGEVKTGSTFYAVGGAKKTGTGTQTLNPANENVPAGYYAATTLSAVDAQLAAANIKSGVNIFGFVGVATVQDIADADAVLADVKNGKTFYSVTGGRKTGNLATVAIAADNNAYPAGYHVGDGGGLSAIDVNLAAANIKSGVNIFGFVGVATVQDIADADLTVGEAPTGKFFYAVTGGRKTGTGTKTLNVANDTVAAGYYAATTLHDVDADLAVGNIKDGVTIFGFLGTFSPALIEDTTGYAVCTYTSGSSGFYVYYKDMGAGTDWDLATDTVNFAAGSRQAYSGFANVALKDADTVKLRFYVNGIQRGETGWLGLYNVAHDPNYGFITTEANAGNIIVKVSLHNYDASERRCYVAGVTTVFGSEVAAFVAAGSIKT